MDGTDTQYKILDRFGLPTLFAIALLGLVVWLVKIQVDLVTTNQMKADVLEQILKNQAIIVGNEADMIMLMNAHSQTLQHMSDTVDSMERQHQADHGERPWPSPTP